jgi:hypothetical protein
MVGDVGGFAMTTPRRNIHVIRAGGELDTVAGARLLRLIDARLQLLDLGQVTTAHILLDFGPTRSASIGAIAGLTRATCDAARRGVGLHLVGAGPLIVTLSVAARQHLGRFTSFPTVAAALDTLSPGVDTSAEADTELSGSRTRCTVTLLPAGGAVPDDPDRRHRP